MNGQDATTTDELQGDGGLADALQGLGSTPDTNSIPSEQTAPAADSDWRSEYQQLQWTTFQVGDKQFKLDTYKAASELTALIEPYGGEDCHYLDAVAEWAKSTFEIDGEVSWAQAERIYRSIVDRSAVLKKSVETSLELHDFTI